MESPSVTTYPSTGVRVKSQRSVFQKGKHVGVATNIYLRKTLGKTKRGLWILKIRVWELFTHGECISTPRARHKGRQSLIECAKMWLQYYLLFSFYIFLFFLGRQGCCPCSYVSSGATRNLDLCSTLSLNVCVLNFFYVFERFILIANKKSFKALDLETMF